MTEQSSPGAAESRWDVPALRAGGSVALAIAVPLTIVARLLNDAADDGDGGQSGLAPWLGFLALLAFVIGAGVAAWHQEKNAPYSHGIVASVGAYAIAQAILLVYALVANRDVSLLNIATSLTFTALAGTVGGFLGSNVQRSGVKSQYRR
jgi:ABC-type transport system involved in cytochrome c biogenesis permease subunit